MLILPSRKLSAQDCQGNLQQNYPWYFPGSVPVHIMIAWIEIPVMLDNGNTAAVNLKNAKSVFLSECRSGSLLKNWIFILPISFSTHSSKPQTGKCQILRRNWSGLTPVSVPGLRSTSGRKVINLAQGLWRNHRSPRISDIMCIQHTKYFGSYSMFLRSSYPCSTWLRDPFPAPSRRSLLCSSSDHQYWYRP